jgi:hypothetical protein
MEISGATFNLENSIILTRNEDVYQLRGTYVRTATYTFHGKGSTLYAIETFRDKLLTTMSVISWIWLGRKLDV